MSTPLLWIAFPAVFAFVALLFRRWDRLIAMIVSGVTILLAAGAWVAPVGELIVIGPWSFTLEDRFVIAGRQFVLGLSDRSILGLIYLLLAFFFIGSLSARVSNLFVPLGLAMGSMLIASLAVEPFLYAALFIQVAVLLGVPLLSPPGRVVDRSVLRYLTFLSLGMPFILFSGWMLSGGSFEASNSVEFLPALVILGFGFAFLLAIFPLNTWIPMLLGRTHPYTATFVVMILSVIAIALLQRFIEDFPWLLDFEVIQFLGLLMVVTGGLWAAFQRDLGRVLGFALIIETGRSLLVIGQLASEVMHEVMLVPRLLAFGVWALSLAILRRNSEEFSFRSLQGMGRALPLIAIGIIAGNFSIVGFPLLAGFPTQLLVLRQLVQISPSVVMWGLLGSVGLLVGGLRTLAVLMMGPEELPAVGKISHLDQFLIIFGMVTLIILGIFPDLFLGFLLPG